mgnify:FL=1
MQHAQDCVQPGYDYFRSLYINPNGKLRNMFLAYRGAQLFDPLFLSSITLSAAYLLCEDLLRFEFPEFTVAFIRDLKKELPRLHQKASEEFPWDTLPGAAE